MERDGLWTKGRLFLTLHQEYAPNDRNGKQKK